MAHEKRTDITPDRDHDVNVVPPYDRIDCINDVGNKEPKHDG